MFVPGSWRVADGLTQSLELRSCTSGYVPGQTSPSLTPPYILLLLYIPKVKGTQRYSIKTISFFLTLPSHLIKRNPGNEIQTKGDSLDLCGRSQLRKPGSSGMHALLIL